MSPEFDLILSGASVVAVIYGLIEALKQAEWLPNKLARLVAMLVGAGGSLAIALYPEVSGVIVRGLALGVIASTGYAGLKKGANDTGDS